MAIQTVAKQPTQSEGPALLIKIRDFFCTVAELLDLYFNSPLRLDILDEEFRARLTVHEKVLFDQGLHGMWPH